MTTQTRLFLALALLCLGFASSAFAEPSANIVFADGATREGNRVDPGNIKQSFTCGEEMFAVIGVEGLSEGEHSLEANWLSPNGEVVKSDAGTLPIPNDQQIAYLSTSVTVNKSGSGEGENSPFKGVWAVEVTADGNIVGRAEVSVDC